MPALQFLRQTVLSPSRLCWVILIYFPSVSDRRADWHLHDSLLQFLHSKQEIFFLCKWQKCWILLKKWKDFQNKNFGNWRALYWYKLLSLKYFGTLLLTAALYLSYVIWLFNLYIFLYVLQIIIKYFCPAYEQTPSFLHLTVTCDYM